MGIGVRVRVRVRVRARVRVRVRVRVRFSSHPTPAGRPPTARFYDSPRPSLKP